MILNVEYIIKKLEKEEKTVEEIVKEEYKEQQEAMN